jgi:O-succinylbenzoic acid--CoA ligase
MELIILNGNVLDTNEHFPEIKLWADEWLSDKSKFEFETSGTLGVPKKMIFSRSQLLASADRTCDFFHLAAGTKVLHRLPMQFVAGKMNIVRALVNGHSVWAEKPSMQFDLNWNPEQLQWDWWTTTPAMMSAFLDAKLDVNVFQKILLGGGKVLPQLMEDMSRFKGNCFESYGATETLTHVAIRSITPIPTHFRLMPGVCVTENKDGIIIHDDVTKIQASLNDAIHFITEKEFDVLGRLDDVINSGGVKIHPLMVEEILSHWTSLPFYITQSHDNLWGNVVTLVVIESDVAHWKNLNLKVIFQNHPKWKPKRMIVVQKIDRNENGKIIRKTNPEGLVNSI